MNFNIHKYRSSLARGASALALTLLLFCGTGCHNNKSTDSKANQPTTEVTTECTSTTITSTVSSTTTTTTATTTTVMTTSRTETTEVTTNQTIVVVTETEPVYISEPVIEPTYTEPVYEQTSNLPITDYERILLRNVVASEYGSDYHGDGGAPVTPYERACVVAVVMNRVNSPNFPNTIEGVLTQPRQFSGYYACNYEWETVTDNVRAGVDYYFEHPDEFGDWLSFEGDGRYNYFS